MKRTEPNHDILLFIIKQLECLSLFYPTFISASIIFLIRKIIRKYSYSSILLENELDRVQKGEFNFFSKDPMLTFSDSTSLW